MKQINVFLRKNLSYVSILFFVFFLHSSCAETETSTTLPRSTPEAEGVSSQAITEFLEAVDHSELELHSFLFLRHGKVIAEGWWYPYKPELKHILYSTSKSFTSTAIGIAVSEGLLTVKDKVVSFFPDDLPDTVSTNLADMAVEDLLSMSAGQDPEPTFSKILPADNWVKAFLDIEVVHDPGTKFLYNSAATYMLSAIISKLTGETVLEYLTTRLFEPLNIEGMDWEVDPMGINVGGWGLRVKTEDMAKFGQLYLQKGKWNGEQIIPEVWVEEATTKKIQQAPELSEEERAHSDWQQGYCYKFWRSRHNSYRADGAYGQYILIMPEQDVVVAITAAVGDMQEEINLVWDHLLPGISNEKMNPDNKAYDQLLARIDALALPLPPAGVNKDKEPGISGKTYAFKEGDSDPEMKYTFSFEDGKCLLTYCTPGNEEYKFRFGSGYWELGETNKPGANLLPQPDENLDEILPFHVAGAYNWEDNTLKLSLRYIEGPHTEYLDFHFDVEEVSLKKNESWARRDELPLMQGKLVSEHH